MNSNLFVKKWNGFATCFLVAVVISLCSTASARPAAPVAAMSVSAFLQDDDEAKSLVQSMAELVYFAAWPTAEYESVAFKSLERVVGGHDAIIRLNGKSAFSGGDLWLDLSIQIRKGKLSDIQVSGHNAILFPPFATSKSAASAVNDLLSEKGSSKTSVQPGSATTIPTVAAVCLVNPTGSKLTFDYRWGNDEWKTVSLDSKYHQCFWYNYSSKGAFSPQFQIRYDADMTNKYALESRGLARYATTTPVVYENARKYTFDIKDGHLGVRPNDWQAEFPHPHIENLISGDKSGKWKPAPGYRWLSPDDVNSLEVVPADYGAIGVRWNKAVNDDHIVIETVLKGSNADRSGLVAGMRIYSINGARVGSRSHAECAELLHGPKGSYVRLEVSRSRRSSAYEVRIQRQ